MWATLKTGLIAFWAQVGKLVVKLINSSASSCDLHLTGASFSGSWHLLSDELIHSFIHAFMYSFIP